MAKPSRKNVLVILPFLFLLLVTLWLTLANLRYSDYQGDEIKALAPPPGGKA